MEISASSTFSVALHYRKPWCSPLPSICCGAERLFRLVLNDAPFYERYGTQSLFPPVLVFGHSRAGRFLSWFQWATLPFPGPSGAIARWGDVRWCQVGCVYIAWGRFGESVVSHPGEKQIQGGPTGLARLPKLEMDDRRGSCALQGDPPPPTPPN